MNEVEKLILENKGLIGKVIKDLKCHISDEEDFQELNDAGMLGLIKGAKTYNGSVKPSTYLYICIKKEILHVFQYRTRKKSIPKSELISLNDAVSNEDEDSELINFIPSEINVEEDALKEVERETVDTVLKNIPARYEAILRETFGIGCIQLNRKELMKKYGVSSYRLENMQYKAMRHFKNEWRKVNGNKRC